MSSSHVSGAHLEDGTRVSAETSRRLARDRGCRFPDHSPAASGCPRAPELPAELLAAVEAGRTTPARAFIAENRERGTDPDGSTASARWKREADIPDEVYFRALEATP